jgi:hypothetical protein
MGLCSVGTFAARGIPGRTIPAQAKTLTPPYVSAAEYHLISARNAKSFSCYYSQGPQKAKNFPHKAFLSPACTFMYRGTTLVVSDSGIERGWGFKPL